MLAEISAAKRKNIEMVLKMVKNKVAKHAPTSTMEHPPNNEQSLLMMARAGAQEDRIMSYEDRKAMIKGKESQYSSQMNTAKSQDKNLDTAHFQTDIQFSELSDKNH